MAISRRQPPPVPHISNMTWEQAKWLLETFLQQSAFIRYEALPAPHAATHMGGSDDVSSSDTPSPISLGVAGSAGTPSRGFAPIDHVHGTEDVELFNLLENLEFEEIDGETVLLVKDPFAAKILTQLILAFSELSEAAMDSYAKIDTKLSELEERINESAWERLVGI